MGLWMFGSGGPFRPDLAETCWLAPANVAPLRRAMRPWLVILAGWPRQAPRPSGARLRMYRQSSTVPIFTSQTGQHPFIFTARFTNFRYWEALGRLLDYTVYFNLFDLRFSLQTVPSTRRISILLPNTGSLFSRPVFGLSKSRIRLHPIRKTGGTTLLSHCSQFKANKMPTMKDERP